jgi:hypothetical protein
MAHTNRARVVLGGLLAGLVINVVEFLTHGVILATAWSQAGQALGKPAGGPSTGAIVTFNIMGFVLGILSVWIYAAIRPRYGEGPATALRAGMAVWAIGAVLPNLGTYAMGIFPTRLLAIATIASLVDILVGTLAGAWVYTERPAQIARAAGA